MAIQSGAQGTEQVHSTSGAEQLPFRLGVYEHFTGNQYQVDGFGRLVFGDGEQENVGEQVVVYHALFTSPRYGEQAVWIRPVDNFTEEIVIDGRTVQRFRYVGEHPSDE
ncbi:DUF1653 domain-containing protein [Wenjunlia tyrosinilytica]|uniref:DUF1653 domain-containing protein n=1 Tax=Wenjunlia tyrosinilytica TaxID=1544741 RepID=A0A918E2J5_9ACTN|nr:DUF1653 domain-containing protein [Wenjunlia tyrosinilytica]GGO99662.1 hypothetical protein GCM10012280_66620 [Wenjunlia tyrosinilytica]